MFCPKCGKDNADDAKFCRGCGHQFNITVSNKTDTDNTINTTNAISGTSAINATSTTDTPNTASTQNPFSTPGSTASQQKKSFSIDGIKFIVAGVGVFIVCCIIQALCGTSMFSTTVPVRYTTTGAVQYFISSLTFYPGWGVSILLVIAGLIGLFIGDKKKVNR